MKKRIAVLLSLLVLSSLMLVACGGNKAPAADGDSSSNGGSGGASAAITSPDDFEGHSVAVQTATTSDNLVTKQVEGGAKIDVRRYEKVTQCFDDLKLGRVDAVYVDSVVAAYYTTGEEGYSMIWKSDEGEPIGICIAKGNDKFAAAIEAAVDTLYYDGTMAQIATKHFGSDFTEGLRQVTEKPTIPTDFATIENGKLLVGVEIGYPPMEYLAADGTTYIGFDIDVATHIGDLLGLKTEHVNTAWDGIFAGLEKGQYDCIISSVSITPERQEVYIMTKPYVANAQCIVVRAN